MILQMHSVTRWRPKLEQHSWPLKTVSFVTEMTRHVTSSLEKVELILVHSSWNSVHHGWECMAGVSVRQPRTSRRLDRKCRRLQPKAQPQHPASPSRSFSHESPSTSPQQSLPGNRVFKHRNLWETFHSRTASAPPPTSPANFVNKHLRFETYTPQVIIG